ETCLRVKHVVAGDDENWSREY
ncbi:hypothetical protein A2U01_0087924, partial [Trifolium medium]|nr:hypothetical protein [Trifolium medium]